MSKPRFGIDLDGVVYNWSDTVRFLLKHYHGYDLSEPDHWDYLDESIKPEHRDWLWGEGVTRGMFRYGHLYKGSAEALVTLSSLADLVVITHRPANAVQDTLEWLAFQRFPAIEVHLLTKQQAKSAIPCDIYLDDGPHNIRDLREQRPDALVMMWHRPWNAGFWHPVTVSSWEEVIAWVSGILKSAR